jgi:hypothetical protein
MKINIGDYVVPIYRLGKVVQILKDQVVVEYTDASGELRYSYLTQEQAVRKEISLDQLVDSTLIVISAKEIENAKQ